MGNGSYKLKPVVRTVQTATSGAIKGKISSAGIIAYVTAISSSNDTYSSNVSSSGDFLIMGLPPGSYSVTVTPALPLTPITVNNINVTVGSTTDIGIIVL
jgi:hypothetical protein